MAKTRDIRRRIKSVENTREITHTMELVSSSRLRRAQERVSGGRGYIEGLNAVGEAFLAQVGTEGHPLGETREPVRAEGILLLTSNRGLCGAFNNNLIREAKRVYIEAETGGRSPVLYLVGRKGLSHFRYLNCPIEASWTEIGDRPTLEDAVILADRMAQDFTGGRVDLLHLVFCRFESAGRQVHTVTTLLPIRRQNSPAEDALLEPHPTAIREYLLPQLLQMRVFRALVETAACEHAARMLAMKNASENAEEMIRELTRSFHRARQAQITQEIAELMGGAEAIKEKTGG